MKRERDSAGRPLARSTWLCCVLALGAVVSACGAGGSTGFATNARDGGRGGAGGGGPSTDGGDDGAPGDDAGDSAVPPACTVGEFVCNGTTKSTCNASGGRDDVDCAPGVCDPTLGCVACAPGTGTCNGDVAHRCLPDGSGFVDELCDSVQGVACEPSNGTCQGACARRNLGTSYIGCEYFPTVLANEVDNNFDYAIAVSNTKNVDAQVTIENGALGAPMTFTVAANSAQVQTLPWQADLKTCNSNGQLECGGTSATAVLAPLGAYHLRSTQPVTVYQFNALEYAISTGQFSYTNDASLLLPANAMTGHYRVVASPVWGFNGATFPGLLAVTGTADGTQVTVTTTIDVPGAGTAPTFGAGIPATITLNRGDVLELLNHIGDLTGSYIEATAPVQVMAGHYCTQMPIGIAACDHLEESMFPVETLSDRYLVTSAAMPSIPSGKEEIVRIVAIADNTTLTYDPPVPGAPTTIGFAGEVVEIPRIATDFEVSANGKILVAQYMEGQEAGGGEGDPAMALAVATAQFRKEYLFHAPTNYDSNYVNVMAPLAATITLDGSPVTGFVPIGATSFGVAKVLVSNGGNGNHTITGTDAFGITVYGYGQYTSYWYAGGLDLRRL